MRYCSRCGSSIDARANYCPRCGSSTHHHAATVGAAGRMASSRANPLVAITAALGASAMAASAFLPWAWRWSSTGYAVFFGADDLAWMVSIGAAFAAGVSGYRMATRARRHLSLLLLLPVGVLASVAVPLPTRSDMLEGGGLAITAASFFVVAILADYLPIRGVPRSGSTATAPTSFYAEPPRGAPHPPAAPAPSRPVPPPVSPASRPGTPAVPPARASAPAGTRPAAEARIVTRTSPPSGASLIDDFARNGERAWSDAERLTAHRHYASGLDVESIALRMHIDVKDVAARLSRDLLDAAGPSLVDPSARRYQARYEQWEYDLMARWPEVSFAEIVRVLGRDQLGAGWRMLDRGIPRE